MSTIQQSQLSASSHHQMGGRGRGKPAVCFNKPPEPTFLRKIKEQLGFNEGPNIDTKREELDTATAGEEEDKEDERPTVVVLKSGDLTAEEAEKYGVFDSAGDDEEEDGKGGTGRVMFKKPTKRPVEASSEENGIRNKLKKKESSMKKVQNKTLLSFDDEKDDDSD